MSVDPLELVDLSLEHIVRAYFVYGDNGDHDCDDHEHDEAECDYPLKVLEEIDRLRGTAAIREWCR